MKTNLSKLPASVREYMARIGRKGGRSTDPERARERARKAGLANAAKYGIGQFRKQPPGHSADGTIPK